MKKTRKSVSRILSLVLAVLMMGMLAACGPAASPGASIPSNVSSSAAESVTLTISAAASLKSALTEIQELYKTAKPEVALTFNFGSSGDLQKQIENGAPADIFFSAANKQMNALKDQSLLLDDTIAELLLNSLVLVVPKDSALALTSFADLAKADVKQIALGEPSSVPAGQYAEEVFTALGNLDAIKAKAVYGKDVTQVLTYVEQGEVDAGVVYKTDALNSDKVAVVAEASADSHTPIVYPIAVVKDSQFQQEAKDFIAFLSTDEAVRVFEKYGFGVN